jgi:hypothetical protein
MIAQLNSQLKQSEANQLNSANELNRLKADNQKLQMANSQFNQTISQLNNSMSQI